MNTFAKMREQHLDMLDKGKCGYAAVTGGLTTPPLYHYKGTYNRTYQVTLLQIYEGDGSGNYRSQLAISYIDHDKNNQASEIIKLPMLGSNEAHIAPVICVDNSGYILIACEICEAELQHPSHLILLKSELPEDITNWTWELVAETANPEISILSINAFMDGEQNPNNVELTLATGHGLQVGDLVTVNLKNVLYGTNMYQTTMLHLGQSMPWSNWGSYQAIGANIGRFRGTFTVYDVTNNVIQLANIINPAGYTFGVSPYIPMKWFDSVYS